MVPEKRPCPECCRGNPVLVHESCFRREWQDYGGEWLFWCTACDRYYVPGQTHLGSFGSRGRSGS